MNILKKCCEANCMKYATSNKPYCIAHKPTYKPRKKAYASSFYSSKSWINKRNYYISNNPLCVNCDKYGQVTLATDVDHIIEIKDGGDKLNIDNLQSLCKSCHTRKTMMTKKLRNKGLLD